MSYDKTKFFKITDNGKDKTSEIIARLRKYFPVWVFDEKNINKNFPRPKKTTTRYFKRVQEADEELKNLSVNDLEAKRIGRITLRERLLIEETYFKETGKHLDVENFTLCSGSRDTDGGVPRVGWDAERGEMGVGWCSPGSRYDYLRARAAVSLKSLTSIPEDCSGALLPEELTINGIVYRKV